MAKIIQFPAKSSNAYTNLEQLIAVSDSTASLEQYFEVMAVCDEAGYFLPGDIDWYGCRWTDVHCFSIVDCRWYYSIGDVTFIMDQEEENEQDMILKKKKEKQLKLGVEL